MSQLPEPAADSFTDLAGAFSRSDRQLCATFANSFSERSGSADRVTGGEVPQGPGCALSDTRGGFGGAYADVCRTRANIASRGLGPRRQGEK
jgi:hypothetical protein